MHKYVIMGVQGCGKGTQAKLLAGHLDLVHISVGDIFRWNIQHHTKLAARVRRIVDAGQLVPDDIVADIVHARLAEHDWNYGFILDGFPRNRAQAEFFLESYDIDAVINVEVPDSVVLQRVLSRRLCAKCGLDYNLIHHRPSVPDRRPVCRGQLVTRADHPDDVRRKRLVDSHTPTQPVLELFAHKELIVTVDGTGPVEAVQAEIRQRLRRLEPGSARPHCSAPA